MADGSLPATIDALLALPAMGRVALSPDGCLVAWTWYRKAPAADIYVAPTDGSAEPRRLTATPDDTTLVSCAADSASLVVAEDRGGDQPVHLFPDSRRALVLAERGTHKRLGIYDTRDETLSWLPDDPPRAIEWAHVPARGGSIVVAEVREAHSRAFLLDPPTRAETPIAAPRGT